MGCRATTGKEGPGEEGASLPSPRLLRHPGLLYSPHPAMHSALKAGPLLPPPQRLQPVGDVSSSVCTSRLTPLCFRKPCPLPPVLFLQVCMGLVLCFKAQFKSFLSLETFLCSPLQPGSPLGKSTLRKAIIRLSQLLYHNFSRSGLPEGRDCPWFIFGSTSPARGWHIADTH